MKLRPAIAILLLAGLLLFPASVSAKSLEVDVEITSSGDMSSWGFSPATLTVPVGTTVTWNNASRGEAHSVTSRDQLFDSRLLDPGEDWSYTFDTPGTYRYFCVPHPWMKGTVVVTASDDEPTRRLSTSSEPTPTPSPSATPSPSLTPSSSPTPTVGS